MHRGTVWLVAVVAAVLGAGAACTSASNHEPASRPAWPRVSVLGHPSLSPSPTTAHSTTPPRPATSRPAPPRSTPTPLTPPRSTPPPPSGPSLPRGGRRILPAYRVVAFYGAPGGNTLGVLGHGTPDQAAAAIERQAAGYARFGRPVQPAMELIATVAQGGPGRDGLYTRPIPDSAIAAYLAAAHRHRLLLILDFQPGRGEFLPQVQRISRFLLDPSVGVALDPEWKVGRHQVPAKVIGSASAASINAVGRYLSALVARHQLPDKLLVVHQFTPPMLPDRARIARPSGLEVVLHADGFAAPSGKISKYRLLAFPCPPFHAGFKLFYRADRGLMTPAQVMRLSPQPEVITYQ